LGKGPGMVDNFSTEMLCARILERHRSTVRVQKTHVAVKKLSLIVEAVLELSNKRGFHATSLRDLSKAAGVSMGSLYSYFDSKTTLLTMILEEVSATVTDVLTDPPDDLLNKPVAHLKWLIDTHIRLTEKMQRWFVFAFMEAKSFPLSARRMATDSESATEQLFTTVLKKGIAQGCFDIDDPSLTAALIKPLLQDWYVKRSKYRKRGISIDDYIRAVSHFIELAVAR
jgi:AcrR family transcriptional regulator